jgi:hypothetical protein
MKKSSNRTAPRPLVLARETIAQLTRDQLRDIAGGRIAIALATKQNLSDNPQCQ